MGFNVGHSAAVWLLAHPLATLVTFDLFATAMGFAALEFLEARFPGRIEAHRGDSRREVPSARRVHGQPRCDVVHIDGRHEYRFVLADFFNLRELATPRALFVFDDQCNATACGEVSWSMGAIYVAGPTLAVCDLVAAGLLTPVSLSYVRERQWGAFKMRLSNVPARQSDPQAFKSLVTPKLKSHARSAGSPAIPAMPCTSRCKLTWQSPTLQNVWERQADGHVQRERREQALLLNHSCGRKLTGPRWDGVW